MKQHQTYQPARTEDTEMREHLGKDLRTGCLTVVVAILVICWLAGKVLGL